jgi:3-oxoacyl-[acyl-carrier-protein] synthase-3
VGLATLERDGRLISDARTLRGFGFRSCRVLEDPDRVEDLLLEAAAEALRDIDRERVSAVILYSGLGAWGTTPGRSVLARFRYPASRVADRLGLAASSVVGLSQQGCSGLLAAVDIAASLLTVEDGGAVLCLAADALPRGSPREVMHSLMSDAAAAILVERNGSTNRIVRFHQLSAPAYWDTPRRRDELVAAYFPMARRAILDALAAERVGVADVRWFVPSNVSASSWRILADLIGAPRERVWLDNVARVAHTVSCDHVINLVEMERQGLLEPGDLLLLFTFGFGASWSTLLVRH